MTANELETLEKTLIERGYKKIKTCLYGEEDYDVYKAFRDEEGELKYQIFYQVWEFERYQRGAGYSTSVAIMPDSIIDNVGRRDLELSTDYARSIDGIEKVEKIADAYYRFITETDKW